MEVLKFSIKVTGIYEWGTGWTSENAKIWKEFFENRNFIYWRYVKDKNGSDFLVSVNTGAMVHPMDGIEVFCEKNDYNVNSINELKNIFRKLAEIYGTSIEEEFTVFEL